MAALCEGRATDATPLEVALIDLVRVAHDRPARLTTAMLDPVRDLAGDGALDYALTLAGFHFINRIADLLGLKTEVLPSRARRLESMRRFSVRAGSRLMRRMDLGNRDYPCSYAEALGRFGATFEAAGFVSPGEALAPLRARPKAVEYFALALRERDELTSLDRRTLLDVHHQVEEALPAEPEETPGLHPRPTDPVTAFAFVGTRYAQRCTQGMIDALRREGFDDLGIMDLAIAVADANAWARFHRLAGLPSELFSLLSETDPGRR